MIKAVMFSSLISMLWFRNSIIQMLLSLELLLISCFISLSTCTSTISLFSLMFFLTIMVSGSALGLSMLVASSRHHHSSSPFHLFILSFDKNH
uniref:NADH-ubiquinone oxidoreductase chain 4L n=2 Tax=Cyriopagopus TaxID=1046901 RepID=Q6JT23_CYRSC|nr:NADH dehydrogenase subunit 4L [Cyriopagopus hainanus]YP_025745.1 NADH dehydrogenase subunit 4L [Cyriopagopus schmidti]AAP51155.1 NADH dehydrogenase subunit 4L [Cyriopagopus schmidti]QOQ36843.1 NADH dehydrogenase subunit 4L [Cyriopagopus hainanus]